MFGAMDRNDQPNEIDFFYADSDEVEHIIVRNGGSIGVVHTRSQRIDMPRLGDQRSRNALTKASHVTQKIFDNDNERQNKISEHKRRIQKGLKR
jgi:hypothetical protein